MNSKDKKDIKKIQKIADIVCEGCGPDRNRGLKRDCGLKIEECDRIHDALKILREE